MTKHTLLTREESLRARDLIRERLGNERVLKIMTAAALQKGVADGTFTGYASTFETEPDLSGDVVRPGAFTQSIRDWHARGAMPPLLWNHETDNPDATLGAILDMKEDGRGLLVRGVLDLDHAPAEAVWRGMKAGRLTTFSFAYAILEEHRLPNGVNSLDVLDCLEVSVTPTPANRSARLVDVKNATTGSNATVTWKGVARGTVFLDESAFSLPEGYEDLPGSQRWHIEERGDSFCVIEEENGTVVSEHATVEGARVRLTDLYTEAIAANELKSINAKLDEIEGKAGPVVDPANVDAFIAQVREEMVQESLERARQAEYEAQMHARTSTLANLSFEAEKESEREDHEMLLQQVAEREAQREREIEEEDAHVHDDPRKPDVFYGGM